MGLRFVIIYNYKKAATVSVFFQQQQPEASPIAKLPALPAASAFSFFLISNKFSHELSQRVEVQELFNPLLISDNFPVAPQLNHLDWLPKHKSILQYRHAEHDKLFLAFPPFCHSCCWVVCAGRISCCSIPPPLSKFSARTAANGKKACENQVQTVARNNLTQHPAIKV